MSNYTMVRALNIALQQEMKKDKTVIILGEDVGVDGGVFRVTEGLLKKFSKERVIDMPLAESGIVGTSIGLALAGFKPVVEIQFSGFIYSAIEQLISHASRIRTRTRGRFSCQIVIRSPYGGGVRALEHHSESMEALYAHIPGIKVVIPSSPHDAKGLLISSIRDPDPVLFLEPKKLYRSHTENISSTIDAIPLGKALIIQSGNDLTIVSWGSMLHTVQGIVKRIRNVNVELIDARTIKPFDTVTILESVKKTGRCIIVHEGPKTCGFAAEIMARIMEKAFSSLKAPVERVTGFDTIFPLYQLENNYLPDEKRIITMIQKVMNY